MNPEIKETMGVREKFVQVTSIPIPVFHVYAMISLLMIFIFCSIYGLQVLNPTYTDWLLEGGDLSQHYLGWKAYQASPWTFPIGDTDYLAYPNNTSIIFTDSIPCFAVLFKLLSPVLPEEFQYFGLWGLLCFVLQGILSARIIRHFTENRWILILSSVLFALAPVMIWRMYLHTALAGQWVLLLALETVFACEKYFDNKKIYCIWFLTGVLASSIHICFLMMCGMILAGYCITDIMACKRMKRSAGVLLTYLVSSGITVGILGGFSSGFSAEADGLGRYSLNLNGLLNPQGWSRIYRDRALYGDGQYEGFAYLGAGCMLLLILVLVSVMEKWKIREVLKRYSCKAAAITVLFMMTFVFALSPVVTMGNRVLFTFPLPEKMIQYWSVFRSSGRFVWVVVYLLMLCSSIVLSKTFSRKMSVGILLVCIFIQVCDISPVLAEKNRTFDRRVIYENQFLKNTEFWSQFSQGGGRGN
ncbi:MAG: hypothetical protein HFH41_02680 [Lachnospiraceae bacterium]|nr:hypothetical protein [Lachnospiraceae bacterium]